MDFNGVMLFEVLDKSGTLVDMRFAFTASQGSQNLALYFFDNNSSADEQANADAAVRARVEGKKPNMKIDVLGLRASNAASQRMTADFNKLASTKGDKAVAKLSKGGGSSFTVNLESNAGKAGKIVVDVPFDGDPKKLAETSFHGQFSLVAHSKEKDVDIAGLINTFLKIKP
jgi:hypothetical protein